MYMYIIQLYINYMYFSISPYTHCCSTRFLLRTPYPRWPFKPLSGFGSNCVDRSLLHYTEMN